MSAPKTKSGVRLYVLGLRVEAEAQSLPEAQMLIGEYLLRALGDEKLLAGLLSQVVQVMPGAENN